MNRHPVSGRAETLELRETMNSNPRSRSKAFLTCFFTTAVLGIVLIGISCYQISHMGVDYRWLILLALTGITANSTLKIPAINSKISVADTFVLTSMIFFGPAAGCIAAAIEAFSGSVRAATKARRLEFALFNVGNVAACAYLAGQTFFIVLGKGPLYHNPEMTLAGFFPAAVILALSYYLLNSGTVALMVALESHKSACRIWKENFLWHAINYIACTFAAVLITVNGSLITPLTLLAAVVVVTTINVGCRNILGRIAPSPHA